MFFNRLNKLNRNFKSVLYARKLSTKHVNTFSYFFLNSIFNMRIILKVPSESTWNFQIDKKLRMQVLVYKVLFKDKY